VEVQIEIPASPLPMTLTWGCANSLSGRLGLLSMACQVGSAANSLSGQVGSAAVVQKEKKNWCFPNRCCASKEKKKLSFPK
jgi:hypothetical protein